MLFQPAIFMNLLLIFLFLLILPSCGNSKSGLSKEIQKKNEDQHLDCNLDKNLNTKELMQKSVQLSCIACHNSDSPKGNIDLSSLEESLGEIPSEYWDRIISAVKGNRMPPNQSNIFMNCYKESFLQYELERKSDLYAVNCENSVEEGESSTEQIKHIINKYCSSCHNSYSNNGLSTLNLTEENSPYQELMSILARVKNGTMPPPGMPSPSDCELDILKAWVEKKRSTS